MRMLLAIFAKDLVSELRLRQVLPTMFVLALVLVTVFGLSTMSGPRSTEVTVAILWLAFTFAGLLAAERIYASEREGHTLAALLTAPVSRHGIFVAKFLASLTMLLIVQAFTIPVALVVFGPALAGPPLLLLAVMLLGDIALMTLGTLTSAMVVAARVRGPLLSVLALPLLVPVLILVTTCSAELVTSGWTEVAAGRLTILAVLDVVFLAASFVMSAFVLEP